MSLSLTEQRQAFTLCLAELIIWAVYEKNWRITLDETKRGKQQQEYYVKVGKSKTMNSKHLDGRAADILLYVNGVLQTETPQYQELGEKWEWLGVKKGLRLVWGGRFGDNPKTKEIEGFDGCHLQIGD